MLFLDQIFQKFCDYMDGKRKWGDPADQWTQTVFEFFTKLNAEQLPIPFVAMREHMQVDYVWRYDPTKYSMNDIELAVESENEENQVDELIKHEIQHLVDVRAHYKIAILYPPLGDETKLLEKTSRTIKNVSERYRIPEEYLLTLGYSTTSGGKRAILWKGYFFDKNGDGTNVKEKSVMQRSKNGGPVPT